MIFNHGGNLFEISKKYKIKISEIIDFSNNLNPLGIDVELIKILQESIKNIKYFPEITCDSLMTAVKKQHSVKTNNYIFFSGSSQIIFLLPLLLKKCSKILIPIPTYSDYVEIFLNYKNTQFIKYCNLENDKILLNNRLEKNCYDAVILCNPNNPLGYYIEKKYLEKLIDSNKNTLFIIDESYLDFVENGISFMNKFLRENCLVIKSLTKILGCPGLRIGYAAAQDKYLNKFRKYLPPWPLNTFAVEAANFYFKNYNNILYKTRKYTLFEINNFKLFIEKIKNLEMIPSSSNFFTIKINSDKIDSTQLQKKLITENKMLIRDCSLIKGLSNKYFRIALKTKTENLKIVNVFQKICF